MKVTPLQNALLTAEAYQLKAGRLEVALGEAQTLLAEAQYVLNAVQGIIHPLTNAPLIGGIKAYREKVEELLR